MADPQFNIIDQISASSGVISSSFLGALLSLRWVDNSLSLSAKLVMVVGGFLAACFGTPLLIAAMALSDHISFGIAFFTGIFGMSLIDAVFSQIKSGQLIEGIKRKLGL